MLAGLVGAVAGLMNGQVDMDAMTINENTLSQVAQSVRSSVRTYAELLARLSGENLAGLTFLGRSWETRSIRRGWRRRA